MKIFIGSSRESLELVREIETWMEERGHETIPWDKPGLFIPGDHTFATLIRISREVDAALFVFGEDDTVWYRGDTSPSPRDNVLIEYGLFAGSLGPRKAIICRNGTPKHAADLAGVTYIDLSERRRAKGRVELGIWANRLTNEPIDPALLSLHGRIAELEQALGGAQEQLNFETEKSKQLQEQLSRSSIIDFSRYDLSTDGHWKLLFDYEYFRSAALLLGKSIRSPVDLKTLVERAGAGMVANRIAWANPGGPGEEPDVNPARNVFLSRKVLRLLRGLPNPQLYRDVLEMGPPSLKADAEVLAKAAVARLTKDDPAFV